MFQARPYSPGAVRKDVELPGTCRKLLEVSMVPQQGVLNPIKQGTGKCRKSLEKP